MVSDPEVAAYNSGFGFVVLILVLMEYGLWRSNHFRSSRHRLRLNPCSNGIWSLTGDIADAYFAFACLNPCSNGIWSLTIVLGLSVGQHMVLILVLMEYGLWHMYQDSTNFRTSLNPCSNGIWSLTDESFLHFATPSVLILVLMEYGLWHSVPCDSEALYCLNPCSNGIWSLTLFQSF